MANASLISHRSTSSAHQPVFSSKRSIAPIGARVNSSGARLNLACSTMRTMGFSPWAATASSEARQSALAPSEMELELAAVIVPSLAKAGLRDGILSGLPFRGCSSSVTRFSPFRVLTVTGAISSLIRPSSMAALARRKLSIANASISSRESPCSSAVF